MNVKISIFALLALVGFGFAEARADYAAIAYSQSTGKYGYSYGQSSRAVAEQAALSHCPVEDAKIVVWSLNNYCALALGDDKTVYGFGWGDTSEIAAGVALSECKKRTTGARVVLIVYSGD